MQISNSAACGWGNIFGNNVHDLSIMGFERSTPTIPYCSKLNSRSNRDQNRFLLWLAVLPHTVWSLAGAHSAQSRPPHHCPACSNLQPALHSCSILVQVTASSLHEVWQFLLQPIWPHNAGEYLPIFSANEKHSPWWWLFNRKGYRTNITLVSYGVTGIYQSPSFWQVALIWNSSVEINTLPCLQLNHCWVRKQISLYHSLS